MHYVRARTTVSNDVPVSARRYWNVLLDYNMEGESPFGLRNYLATTEVDDLGPDSCRVTCTERFDLPSDAPLAVATSVIEAVYKSIINDIPKLIMRQSAV